MQPTRLYGFITGGGLLMAAILAAIASINPIIAADGTTWSYFSVVADGVTTSYQDMEAGQAMLTLGLPVLYAGIILTAASGIVALILGRIAGITGGVMGAFGLLCIAAAPFFVIAGANATLQATATDGLMGFWITTLGSLLAFTAATFGILIGANLAPSQTTVE